MTSQQRDLLKRLLKESIHHPQRKLTEVCYNALMAGEDRNFGSSKVLTKNLAEIYERRSEYKHLIAEGFEIVVPALKTTTDEFTRIHGFTAENTHYVVFTNVGTTKLLGLIAVKGSSGEFRV